MHIREAVSDGDLVGDPAAVLGSSLWSAPLLFRALGECTSKWNSLSVSLCLSAQKKEPIYLQTSILFWSQLALWGVECLTPGGTYLSAGILSEERETHGDASTIQLSQHTASCPSMTGAETGPENEGCTQKMFNTVISKKKKLGGKKVYYKFHVSIILIDKYI